MTEAAAGAQGGKAQGERTGPGGARGLSRRQSAPGSALAAADLGTGPPRKTQGSRMPHLLPVRAACEGCGWPGTGGRTRRSGGGKPGLLNSRRREAEGAARRNATARHWERSVLKVYMGLHGHRMHLHLIKTCSHPCWQKRPCRVASLLKKNEQSGRKRRRGGRGRRAVTHDSGFSVAELLILLIPLRPHHTHEAAYKLEQFLVFV